jgi:hypothetical protein
MRTTKIAWASLALVPILAPGLGAFARAASIEIADDDAMSAVKAAEVARRGDAVVGTLVNRGGDEVRDIRILIDMPFLWTNEVKPGDESPGRSVVTTIAGPIAPHGTIAFEFTPNPPLPVRNDGRFTDPQVRVLGYQFVATR